MSRDSREHEMSYEEDDPETATLLNLQHNSTVDEGKSLDSTIFLKLYAIVFCINLGLQILAPAQTKIFEAIYCLQWYERHPIAGLPIDGAIPESYCKIAPVQTQISTLKGWLESFSAAPGLLLSIPMGMLADAFGRRRLIIMNLTVLFLTQAWITFVTWFDGQLPLRAVWLGAGLNFLSGGTIVTELLYVVC